MGLSTRTGLPVRGSVEVCRDGGFADSAERFLRMVKIRHDVSNPRPFRPPAAGPLKLGLGWGRVPHIFPLRKQHHFHRPKEPTCASKCDIGETFSTLCPASILHEWKFLNIIHKSVNRTK